ncbi:kinase-like domain-containing protein [Jimgerdemannia flammicorona]|uniref:Kinase-like domain-containing protein n=1 Tax=Jimgerdemannia flammicorona TaxID=994334 RepID=A0A433D265_9FUNG|nr:kinase-like domain-containing protein [Jimgerdemannia flammicorona]
MSELIALPELNSAQFLYGVPVYYFNPQSVYEGLSVINPTWPSAQGCVYCCREAGGERRSVVIKKYLFIEYETSTELIENEIYIMAKCAPHPNILQLQSIYIYDSYIFLVTPFCDGGTLHQYCIDNHVTLPQMAFILKGLVSGLSEIHKNDGIHRDIKCENVFLGKDNTIVIGDFGVSSLKPTVDSSVEKAGVILFWAPEVCECKKIDLKADIWALGIVVLEMLNHGKAPYEDNGLEDEEIKRKIIQQDRPPFPENMDSQLVDFMDQCFKRDPEQRASTSELLKV